MSTNYMYRCNTHPTPIDSDYAGTNWQGLSYMRSAYKHRKAVLNALDVHNDIGPMLEPAPYLSVYPHTVWGFLREHADCALEIVSEYDEVLPVSEEEDRLHEIKARLGNYYDALSGKFDNQQRAEDTFHDYADYAADDINWLIQQLEKENQE